MFLIIRQKIGSRINHLHNLFHYTSHRQAFLDIINKPFLYKGRKNWCLRFQGPVAYVWTDIGYRIHIALNVLKLLHNVALSFRYTIISNTQEYISISHTEIFCNFFSCIYQWGIQTFLYINMLCPCIHLLFHYHTYLNGAVIHTVPVLTHLIIHSFFL